MNNPDITPGRQLEIRLLLARAAINEALLATAVLREKHDTSGDFETFGKLAGLTGSLLAMRDTLRTREQDLFPS